MYVTHLPDRHGNQLQCEGLARCACGCKYYELDRCIDCGTHAQINLQHPRNNPNWEIADAAMEAESYESRIAAIKEAGIARINASLEARGVPWHGRRGGLHHLESRSNHQDG